MANDEKCYLIKFMLQSQVSKLSEIADCSTFLRCLFVKCKIPMFICSNVKMAFCFVVINSVLAVTRKTINDVRAEFF